MCPFPLESQQAEETEATQAEPVGEKRERAEPSNHLLSRHPQRQWPQQDDRPTENNIKATCRLRLDLLQKLTAVGTYTEDSECLQMSLNSRNLKNGIHRKNLYHLMHLHCRYITWLGRYIKGSWTSGKLELLCSGLFHCYYC